MESFANLDLLVRTTSEFDDSGWESGWASDRMAWNSEGFTITYFARNTYAKIVLNCWVFKIYGSWSGYIIKNDTITPLL